MNILIKQARIISDKNPNNNKVMDILVEGGKIVEIKKSISAKGNIKVIEEEGLCVSSGWLDLQTVSCDPGFEHKEDINSLIDCAAAGGFTGVCIHSYNNPALHNKAQIEYIINKTKNKVVDVYPLGTITVDAKGKDLAEMYDMKRSGAVGFSDYKHAIKDAGTLMRALQYAVNVDSFIITHCNDESISHGGQMNEGEVAVGLGLKGIPALAEELMLQRNLSVLEYTGGKMHIPTISTKGSIDLIKKAKANGLNVTAGVSSLNLYLDDSSLKEFDTNYKLNPPLRSKKDVQALRNAVENGTISVIVSDHLPQDIESKELEFDLADNGAINLQTSFSCALEALKEDNINAIVRCFTSDPRNILGIEEPKIEEGSEANLTLFSTSGETTLTEKTNNSRSKNSPFFNKTMKGKVIGIVNGSKSYFN
ncbi:MAG: dihydroorotase [Bacteroidetes bacterium]|jgi:dihydroorotase|nr:dihydroorotase [Bacteroidota bacterium]